MFSAAMLHSELLARLKHPRPQKDRFGRMAEFRRSPVYVVTTTDPKAVSMELGRRISRKAGDSIPEPFSSDSTCIKPMARENAKMTDSSPVSPLSSSEDPSDDSPKFGGIDPYTESRLNKVLSGGDLDIPHVLISLALEG